VSSPGSGGVGSQVARVLYGYTQLSYTEQQQFLQQLDAYRRATPSQREIKKGNFANRMNLGPTGPTCAYCGK